MLYSPNRKNLVPHPSLVYVNFDISTGSILSSRAKGHTWSSYSLPRWARELLFVFETGSLCSTSWSGSQFLDQVGLKLPETCLPKSCTITHDFVHLCWDRLLQWCLSWSCTDALEHPPACLSSPRGGTTDTCHSTVFFYSLWFKLFFLALFHFLLSFPFFLPWAFLKVHSLLEKARPTFLSLYICERKYFLKNG